MKILCSRCLIREDPCDIDSFTPNAIDALGPKLECGKFAIVKTKKTDLDQSHFYSPDFLDGFRMFDIAALGKCLLHT